MALVENIERGMIIVGAAGVGGSAIDSDPIIGLGGLGIMLTAGVVEVVKNVREKKKLPRQIPLEL